MHQPYPIASLNPYLQLIVLMFLLKPAVCGVRCRQATTGSTIRSGGDDAPPVERAPRRRAFSWAVETSPFFRLSEDIVAGFVASSLSRSLLLPRACSCATWALLEPLSIQPQEVPSELPVCEAPKTILLLDRCVMLWRRNHECCSRSVNSNTPAPRWSRGEWWTVVDRGGGPIA
ncbi:uncharacterized protein F5Z01DRAFT_476134 [Emericellopsis atlantica]|uniref:Secreted protein n=1 Tax=Emericellopsis atlantica TaxID=2614577 RepID=A0A9P7ZRI9_9HYPO|nr:uncharacterized protein F5Z01DRAFT_476134 [Emericellopsis atlantica]KAG9256506.1 hypothetical protein F5Z01DRAFT_476134 [Emericellopsis atlantica]